MSREYRSPSVDRAFEVLRLLGEQRDGMTLSGLAHRTEIPTSTLMAILGSLIRAKMVAVEPGKRYRLGVGVFQLGQAFLDGADLTGVFGRLGKQLNAVTGEIVQLGVLSGKDVVYIARHEPLEPATLVVRLGRRIPAHASAQGKVLLAGMTNDEVRDLLGLWPLAAFTPSTITDLDRLLDELDQIRGQGFGEAREECVLGLHCLAVPVQGDKDGALAAMSLSIPLTRFDPMRKRALVELLWSTAARITESMVGRAADRIRPGDVYLARAAAAAHMPPEPPATRRVGVELGR